MLMALLRYMLILAKEYGIGDQGPGLNPDTNYLTDEAGNHLTDEADNLLTE